MNTIDITKQLIAIPSYVGEDCDEKEIGEFIFQFLKKNTSLEVTKQPVENNRFNVIAKDSCTVQTILLGHMDTVLPKAQTKESFTPKIVGNKLYGLGSVDMKAGLAIMLSLAATNKQQGIMYVFTCDEEYEFKGIEKYLSEYSLKPTLVINLEPTNMEILLGCRGIIECTFALQGKAAHASRKNRGINAIETTYEIIKRLEENINALDNSDMQSSVNLAYLQGGILADKKSRMIKGIGNIIPDYAVCKFEIRVGNEKITPRWVEKKLLSLAKQYGVTIEDIAFPVGLGSFYTEKATIQPFAQTIKQTSLPIRYKNINTAGFYELQLISQAWKVPCIAFGPGPADNAHAADEYVSVDEILLTEQVIRAYIEMQK